MILFKKNIEEFMVAPWIKTLKGQKGTIVYDFCNKTAYQLSFMLWDYLTAILPATKDSIMTSFITLDLPIRNNIIEDYIESLINLEILISRSRNIDNKKFDISFSDESNEFHKGISLEITSICNFKCIHCYVGDYKDKKDILPFETLISLRNQFLSLGVTNVQITGGEPLSRNDAPEIIKFFTNDFEVELTTNGSLINDSVIKVLENVKVQVSIYGFSESTFEQFTRTDAKYFRKTIENILKLKKSQIDTTLSYVVTPQNKHELDSFIEFCKKFDFNYILGFSMPVGECKNNICQLAMSLQEKKDIITKYLIVPREKCLKRYSCSPNKISILANGQVSPCNLLRDSFIYGNINSDNIKNLWEIGRSKFKDIVDIENKTPCKDCELKYICGGTCPALDESKIHGETVDSCIIYNSDELMKYLTV